MKEEEIINIGLNGLNDWQNKINLLFSTINELKEEAKQKGITIDEQELLQKAKEKVLKSCCHDSDRNSS